MHGRDMGSQSGPEDAWMMRSTMVMPVRHGIAAFLDAGAVNEKPVSRFISSCSVRLQGPRWSSKRATVDRRPDGQGDDYDGVDRESGSRIAEARELPFVGTAE
jgi:hypothetical protein